MKKMKLSQLKVESFCTADHVKGGATIQFASNACDYAPYTYTRDLRCFEQSLYPACPKGDGRG